MLLYADLELTIRRRELGSYVVELRLDVPWSEADIRLPSVGVSINVGELRLVTGWEKYVAALSGALFSGPAGTQFNMALAVIQSHDAILRVKLVIDPDAPELHSLHWEALPEFSNERVAFSRYLSALDWRPVTLPRLDVLKALVVIANPINLERYRLATVDVDAEHKRAKTSLDGSEVQALLSPGDTTLQKIIGRLRDGFDILYLVCHAALINGNSRVYLARDDGNVDPVKGAELVRLIQDLPRRPSLIVLASCQSAAKGMSEEIGSFASAIGPQFADAGVPAVVAMRGKITVETVERFMPEFFRELLRDGQIDRAMGIARRAVRSRSDFWMPVLFMRLKKGQLWIRDPRPTGFTPLLPPPQISACYGREDEIEKLYLRLIGTPDQQPVLVCWVYGLPGVGKSLLVEAFANRYWERYFPGGYAVLKFDPQSPQTVADLLGLLAAQLDIRGDQSSTLAAIRDRLKLPGNRTLLHLENVDSEELARVAAQLTETLRGAPIVLSSRIASLGNQKWRPLPVHPLTEMHALSILNEYRQPANVTERAQYGGLVRRLGCLPLALHLVGAQIREGVQTAATLLANQEFLDINSTDPTKEGRRRQLRACFQISLDAFLAGVADREQALAALADFGHAPLDGIGASLGAAWCGLPEAEFRRVLSRAAKFYLAIHSDADGRESWRAHPLLADFLRSLYDVGPDRLVRAGEWFMTRFPQGDDQRVRWDEITAELAALPLWMADVPSDTISHVVAAAHHFAIHRGPYRLWITFCQRGLELAVGADRMNLLWTLTHVAHSAGDSDLSMDAGRKCADLAQAVGDARKHALSMGKIADILQARGNLDEALRILQQEVLPAFEKLGDVRSRAVTMGKIADILQSRGNLDEVLRIRQQEELPVYEKLGDVRSRAVTMGKIADILQSRGNLDEALRIRQQEQLPVYEKLGDVRERAVTMGNVADILEARGNLDEALRIRQQEELPVYEKLGDVRSRAVTMAKIADILQSRGNMDEALRILQQEVLPAFEKLGDVRSRAVTMGKIADILQSRGNLDEALRILQQEVLPAVEDLGDVRSRAVTMGKIADILEARGNLDEALRIRQQEELPVYEKLGDVHSRAVTMGQIADILEARGNLDEALRIRQKEQLPVYEKLGDVRSRAVTMGKIADILEARGNLDEALRILQQEVLPAFEKLGDVRSRAVTMAKIADILEARGNLDEALRIFQQEVRPAFEDLGDVRSRAVTMGKIADILQSRGNLDEALRIRQQEELPVYEKLGDVRSRAVTMGKIADILQARGNLDEALRIRQQEQLPVYEKLGDVRSRAVTMGKIAGLLQARGDLDGALRTYETEVLPVLQQLGDERQLVFARYNTAAILAQRNAPGDRERGFALLRLSYEGAKRMQLPIAAKLAQFFPGA